MNRMKLLLQNIFVYGLGGIMAKAIPLIMVPIITRLFPNSFYYGLSDLSNTIVSLFSALAIMGMYDAMYRMFFEKKEENYQKEICSSAFFFTCITSTVVFFLMIILQQPISALFYSDKQYGNLVILCALSVLVGGTNSIVSAPTRMQNKKVIYLITNALSPILSYSIAIPLILNEHYIIALPLAILLSSFSLEIIFFILNHKWFSLKCINWKYIKSMLKIALPLLPNFLIYWIFNSSDRVMISNLISTEASGVYAVAAKIGQVSQLIYLAFAGGWQFFAFSIMKDDDNVQVISKVFEVLAILSFVTTIFGTAICKWGMELLFEEEYWLSYICVPYLYLAPLLLMLFQIGSNQFLVIKKTWPNLLILLFGAAINITLNFVLIPIMGIEGASIATFTGYFISIFVCVIVLLKLKLLKINYKLIIILCMFLAVFAIMRVNKFSMYALNIPLACSYAIVSLLLYHKELKMSINKIKNRKSKSIQSLNEPEILNTESINENLNNDNINENSSDHIDK